MDEVVVAATRWDQNTRDVPMKITSLSPGEIRHQNPQTSADLLGVSGEVFIQKSQLGGGSPMIRGFATSRLLYQIDGIRMNTAIFRSGNIQNVISLDPYAMERTEILFGPGSVVYGSDAIGGVMVFQTLTPQLSFSDKTLVRGQATARHSSVNNELSAHADVNVGWNQWASMTSFSTFDFDHQLMGGHGPDEYLRPFYVQRQDSVDIVVTNEDTRLQRPSGYSQMNMMQKIRFVPAESWDLQYGFHYSETSKYARYDRHIRYRAGQPRYGEWDYGPQIWMMNNLTASHRANNSFYDQLTIRLAQQHFEESRIDRNINDAIRHHRVEDVEAYSLNLDFNVSLGSRGVLFYGAEIVTNDVTSVGTDEDIIAGVSEPGPSRYPQSTWDSYAAYLSYQHRVSDAFLVQAGARYNRFALDAVFDTTFYPFPFTTANLNDGALTGSLGCVFRPAEDWVISANAATGFRAPNVDDVGKVFDSEAGSVVVPNPNLAAEYAYNADLGIAKAFGEVVKLDLTGYYTSLQDAMVRRDYQLNGMDSIVYAGELSQVQAIQNAAMATVYGIQAGIEITVPSGFSLTSDFNYQVGEEELDDGTVSPSRHAAPWFGVSRLRFASTGFLMEFYAAYSGEKAYEDLPEEEKGKPEIYAVDPNGNPYSPGWYTLNVKVSCEFTDHLTLHAGIENLTDQRYRPYSSGIVSPGRNFVISLDMRGVF